MGEYQLVLLRGGGRTKTLEIPSAVVVSERLYPTDSSAERTTSIGPMMFGVPLSTGSLGHQHKRASRDAGHLELTDGYQVRERLSVDHKESRVFLRVVQGNPGVNLGSVSMRHDPRKSESSLTGMVGRVVMFPVILDSSATAEINQTPYNK